MIVLICIYQFLASFFLFLLMRSIEQILGKFKILAKFKIFKDVKM